MTETPATEAQRSTQVLKERKQYQGWLFVIRTKLKKKKWMDANNKVIASYEEDIMDFIIDRIELSIVSQFPLKWKTQDILNYLEERFGGKNKRSLREDYKQVKMIGINCFKFIEELQIKFTEAYAGGAIISEDDQLSHILENCHQMFYSEFIRKWGMKAETETVEATFIAAVQKDMKSFYNHSSPAIKAEFLKKGSYQANLTETKDEDKGNKKDKKDFKKRNCDLCKVHRPKYAESHDTPYCRFKSGNTAQANNNEDQENKEVEGYFYDTAATKSFTQ